MYIPKCVKQNVINIFYIIFKAMLIIKGMHVT